MFVSCSSGVYRIHFDNKFVEVSGSLGVPVKRNCINLESLYSTNTSGINVILEVLFAVT